MSKISKKLPDIAKWKHFGGEGEPAHFYHANGFPLGVYNPVLSRLEKRFRLSTLEWRATWHGIGMPPKKRDWWQIFADDLISFIEHEFTEPIIGIGHSMGASCTAMAAVKRPDLFRSLVLIEPAMVSKPIAFLIKLLPKAILNMTEPAKSTLSKQTLWESRESFEKYCRKFPGYKRLTDEAFKAMHDYGVVQAENGGFRLGFPKEWEAHNYTQATHMMDTVERIKVPCVAIRAKPSVFFSEKMWHEWQVRCPDTIFKENLNYGHLLPIENPSACFDLINEGLKKLTDR